MAEVKDGEHWVHITIETVVDGTRRKMLLDHTDWSDSSDINTYKASVILQSVVDATVAMGEAAGIPMQLPDNASRKK